MPGHHKMDFVLRACCSFDVTIAGPLTVKRQRIKPWPVTIRLFGLFRDERSACVLEPLARRIEELEQTKDALSHARSVILQTLSWFKWIRILSDAQIRVTRVIKHAVLRIRIRDPVPFWPLDLGSGMGKKSGSGSGMNSPDHISESLETIGFLG